MPKRSWSGPAGSILAILAVGLVCVSAAAANEGTIKAIRNAESSFNEYTDAPSPATKEWLRTHFWRILAFSPYFDSRTSWYPNAWAYRDAYAVYNGNPLVQQHPEWILKDNTGKKLYIPWGCSGGTCPQYAGNFANAGFRQNWIEEARAMLAHGYKGLYLDDVNMDFRVSNGWGETVAPIDPATGRPMSEETWRQYLAQFMEQIRAAFPGVEIVHNVIWYSDQPIRLSDPYIQREIQAASVVSLERGVDDAGLTGGTGEWSLEAFLSFIDGVHSLGRAVSLGNSSNNEQGRTYDLAAYFLVSNGSDSVNVEWATPREWWPGWEMQLGAATGARYHWKGLLRRDFANGYVLLNPPGGPTITLPLANPMRNASGQLVTSVTLPAASGAVLHRRYVKPTAAATGALEVAGNASAEEALSEPTPGSETGLLPVLPAPGAALPGEAASFVPTVNEASAPVPSPQPATVAPKRAAAPGHAKPHRKRRRRVKRHPPRRSRGAKVGLIHSASRQPR